MRYIKEWQVPSKTIRGGHLVLQEHDPQFLWSRDRSIYYTVDPEKPISVKSFYVVCGSVPYEEGKEYCDLAPMNIPDNCKLVGQLYTTHYDWNEKEHPGSIYTYFLFEQQ